MSELSPPGASAISVSHPKAVHSVVQGPHIHAEHFQLAPEMAHLPLALRRQRLGAILVDLLLVALLSWVLSSVRLLVCGLLALLAYWVMSRLSAAWAQRIAVRASLTVGIWVVLSIASYAFDAEDGSAHAPGLAQRGHEHDEDDEDDSATEAEIASALAQLGQRSVPLPPGSPVQHLVAATPVAVLSARVARLERELKDAREQRGIMHFVKASAHDIGFGIGWSYLYFIGFLTLWNGLTPGKRMFSIRVARIDGRPMSLWRAWERFHGYAASMLTGLLGFGQILWDANRQCLHDKVAETVVVQDIAHAAAVSRAG
jgi:hypothetical protein